MDPLGLGFQKVATVDRQNPHFLQLRTECVRGNDRALPMWFSRSLQFESRHETRIFHIEPQLLLASRVIDGRCNRRLLLGIPVG